MRFPAHASAPRARRMMPSPASDAPTAAPRDATRVALSLGIALLLGGTFALRTLWFTLGDVAEGHGGTLPLRLFLEGTGSITAIPLVLVAIAVTRRVPLGPGAWPRALALHALALTAASVAHTLLIAATRATLADALGLDYHYGPLAVQLFREAPNDLIAYATVAVASALATAVEARRERERRTLALERELARVELEQLQLQLQPHFLFNALNTISATMYADPDAADAMLGHLADLLRHALGQIGRAEAPLTDELRLLDCYLALARARFGDALRVTLAVDDDARAALVPPLLLQPLVENAIRHAPDAAHLAVTLRARRDGARLVLEVENPLARTPSAPDGRQAAGHERAEANADTGADAGADAGTTTGFGLGLATTRRRLALLHGPAGTLDAGPVPEAPRPVFRVRITLPWRSAEPDAERDAASGARPATAVRGALSSVG